jgi:hypothetical protein
MRRHIGRCGVWDPVVGGHEVYLPAGLDDPRPGIWISYIPLEQARRDVTALTHVHAHRLVALPEYYFESVKINGVGTSTTTSVALTRTS